MSERERDVDRWSGHQVDRRTLTDRETQLVLHLVDGKTNQEIAQSMGVSPATVKRHLYSVMIKWNCRNRTEVAIKAIETGFTQAHDPGST